MSQDKSNLKRHLAIALGTGITLFSTVALAGGGGGDLQSLASNLTEQLNTLAGLLVVVAYVAGIGFALGGVVKFKAHRDNPTQVPLSQPIVYLIVAACLLFLPTLMKTAGATLFGEDKTVGTKDFSASDL